MEDGFDYQTAIEEFQDESVRTLLKTSLSQS